MAFQYPVPAQRSASAYLDMVARLWEGPIILVGHSKGGNLAIYAAMNADPKVAQAHSACLFTGWPRFPAGDCDQPRLPHHPAEGDENRAEFVDCGHDFSRPRSLPQWSLPIRMASCSIPAFTWLLDGDQFITEPDLSSSSQLFNEELNHWIATLTPEQRERAVDALFTVLHANGATSFSEVMSNFPASIPGDAWRVRWADPRRPASFG